MIGVKKITANVSIVYSIKLWDKNFCLTNTKVLIKRFSLRAVDLKRLSSSKREKSLPTEITHLDLNL